MAMTLEPLTSPVSADEIRRRIARVPRVPLALTPTPLQDAPRLAKELGIGRLLVKRDDLTGLAFGGNKTRNLEFRMAEAVELGDHLHVVGEQPDFFVRLPQRGVARRRVDADVRRERADHGLRPGRRVHHRRDSQRRRLAARTGEEGDQIVARSE